MQLAYDIQYWLYMALGLIALVIELWALADCVGRKADYFQAAFKNEVACRSSSRRLS